MKEFISKWSNWWILAPKRKQLDEAFEKELNELIEREVALRIHNVVGRSEQFYCLSDPSEGGVKRCKTQCKGCENSENARQ